MTRLTCHLVTAPGTGWGRITRRDDVLPRMQERLGSPDASGRWPVLYVTYDYAGDRRRVPADETRGEG